MRADLHIHSVSSDGLLLPSDIVGAAVAAHIGLVAVTDHDGMQSCAPLKKIAVSAGIRAVNGIEVSAYVGDIKFHVLGYGLDEAEITPFLKDLYEASLERAEEILQKFAAIGKPLTMEEVNEKRYSLTTPVHSVHIARAMISKGYVKDVPEFFRRFAGKGNPAYSPIGRPSPLKAVMEITAAGGFASVAHPGRIRMERDELAGILKSLKGEGLGGIEAYYTTHTVEETEYYKNLAAELSMLVTGGSDTHIFGAGREIGSPVFHAGDELLERLKID